MTLKASSGSSSYATFGADGSVSQQLPHPQERAWCLSRLVLGWVTPLMALGHTKQLSIDDLWPLRRSHETEYVSVRFSSYFQRNKSIPMSFFRMFSTKFVLTGVALLISMLCNLMGPVVLERVVSSLTTKHEVFDLSTVFRWVLALFVAQVVQALADNYANFNTELIAMQFTACLKTLLYQKGLRLSAKSRKEKPLGAITTIFTSDCDAILTAAYSLHQAWLIPLQITIVSYMLYRVLGVASFAGIGVLVAFVFANHLVSKLMFSYMDVYRTSQDIRIKKVTELFKAVNIIKFNAWEDRFMERIQDARSAELRDLLRFHYGLSGSIALSWGMPVFVSLALFGTYALVLHRELSPSIVFSSLALFQLIRNPMRNISLIISELLQAKVALNRADSFLNMPELDPDSVLTIDHPTSKDKIDRNVIISIEKGEFGWDNDNSLLRDVNLQVHAGDFYVLHGTVGCGKSSLCSALLGEMIKRNGQVYVGGTVAYCSQQPWIQNMTVRENILFGLPYDHKKYQKVIDACALTADLETLPAGDRTEIGERGVNVSGGQKSRIALARACYSDASIYILDSPLSAVDAIVQNEIFQKCLLGLLRHKTILLVTHNPEIIASKHITHAITVNDVGTLVETHRIENRDLTYQSVVTPLAAHSYGLKSYTEVSQLNEDQSAADIFYGDVQELKIISEAIKDIAMASSINSPLSKAFTSGQLIDDENRSEGRVSNHVFTAYFRAIGGFRVVSIILLCQLMWQGLQISSDFWLSSWSSDSLSNGEVTKSTEYRLGMYATLSIAAALMVVIRTLLITFYGLQAAKNLFNQMTTALLHAPMRFFDTNPIGRILTRYGSDISTVDGSIPFMFGSFLGSLFSVGCSFLTAAIVIQWRGLLLVPVVYLYIKLGGFYIEPARELQRILKTTEAPVLSHLSESIDGASVVRSFGYSQLHRFHSFNYQKLNDNNKAWFAQLCVSQWFSLHIQLLGSIFLLVITSSLVLLRYELSAAVIGLAFSYGLNVSQNLEHIVQALSQVETAMVSPERIQEYIDIPQEPPSKIPSMDPAPYSQWPFAGAIGFSNVCFRYKENDALVLNEINFYVEGGQKIGIVGRTGAGKSSLTMALFRINELTSGTITIDGVDTSTIGIQTLREKISIIPQNPVLFKGPLRHYLDPFDDFSDDELWESIRQVGLSDRISQEENKLQCIVEENGENFSVGERQMLCMAQALLRHTRIVVFDEATAAIDHETDEALQKVIRTAFVSSTVLTIAHRLDTILDSDKILVLDDGRVVEFASPKELVAKGSGHFFDLMQEGGYLDKFSS